MPNILIVDDHPIVRAGIKQLISAMTGMSVTAETGSAHETIALLRRESFPLIILDISLPDISGIELLHEIKKMHPESKVLVLSRHREKHYAIRALKLGALGYVHKQNVADELVKAIDAVSRGRRYISPEIAEMIIEVSLSPEGEHPPHTILSEREFEVFRLLAQGKSVSACAEALYLSPNTVSTYKQRIFTKLHLASNAELIRYALDYHLID